MANDTIGRITVPAVIASGVFPLAPDYGSGLAIEPEIAVHAFSSGNTKIEQRFVLGRGVRQFNIRKARLTKPEHDALVAFWEANNGAYGAFTYNAPNPDGATSPVICRFKDPALTLEYLKECLWNTLGVTLVEEVLSGPVYPLNATVTRFPTAALENALADQVQEVFPLIRIRVRESAVDDIFLSDRRVAIGSQLYLPRLADWDGISQSVGGEADQARFVFGNADRVMTLLANDTDLWRAEIEFSLFHVGTGTKIDLWKGEITDWSFNSGPEFSVTAADGLYELGLPYPSKKATRTCWKMFNDGANCPFSSQGRLYTIRDLQQSDGSTTHYTFSPSGSQCDKGFDTPNGCLAHGMEEYFGGIVAKPQAVRVKDNTSKFSRPTFTSASLIADSVYGKVLREIYYDSDLLANDKGEHPPMPVNCDIVAGRDEGDFYCALGIVGQGPLGEYTHIVPPSAGKEPDPSSSISYAYHTLDGQPPHGPYPLGLRECLGPDPNPAPFSLGEGGNGVQRYGPERAAGTAFIEIRRTDDKGLQLSKLSEHSMQAYVSKGLAGYVWTAPGARTLQTALTNPIWIAVNCVLKAKGVWFADAAAQEKLFDVDAAVNAAAICDTVVNAMVGAGTERQFIFNGVIDDEKPLKDWINDILMNCLGYYTFSFGKLKLGTRFNSSATEAFTEGNIVFQSLELSALKPQYNHITASFGDVQYDFVQNSVSVYDADHAAWIGGATSPLFTKGNINLSGTATKSQAARIVTARLREELGGASLDEIRKARQIAFKTTILSLNVEPGAVCSITHPDMPDGTKNGQTEPNYGEFRVLGWRLNKDYSIDIQGKTTTDSMYDMITGHKPADVDADPIPEEEQFPPADFGYGLDVQDGKVTFKDFFCNRNASTVHQATFDLFYVPEDRYSLMTFMTTTDANTTDIQYNGAGETLEPGDLFLVDGEIMQVVTSTPGAPVSSATVKRGLYGTTAGVHGRVSSAISSFESNLAVMNVTGPFEPGNTVVTNPNGEWTVIASYDNGKLTTMLPFTTLDGQSIYSDPRMYRVLKKTVVIPFAPRFFRSAARADFTYSVDLPNAGLVAIRAVLENTRGLRSEPSEIDFASRFPHRWRTGGHSVIVMAHPTLPDGLTENAFETIRMPSAQGCISAHADIRMTDGPITAPAAVSTVRPGKMQPNGTIQIGGTINSSGRIGVVIKAVSFPAFPITTETTAAQAASHLADWLNGLEEFSAFYYASAASDTVSITDLKGLGGEIAVNTSGGVTATATGLTNTLGVVQGRKYAVSFQGGTYESPLSPLSDSSGPTGAASSIELKGIPQSYDNRVTTVRIWAAPDGQEGPMRLAGTVDNGTTEWSDAVTESALAGNPVFPGTVQPELSGTAKITVKKDDAPWFELRLENGVSNAIDGLALNALPEGAVITADVDSTLNTGELRIFID